jgi:hypothetical protein
MDAIYPKKRAASPKIFFIISRQFSAAKSRLVSIAIASNAALLDLSNSPLVRGDDLLALDLQPGSRGRPDCRSVGKLGSLREYCTTRAKKRTGD